MSNSRSSLSATVGATSAEVSEPLPSIMWHGHPLLLDTIHTTRACESCLVLCSRSPPAGKESKRMFAPVSEKRLESSKNTCMTEFTSDAPCRLADAVSNCVALLAAVLAGWEQGLGLWVTVLSIHATRSFGSSATLIIRRDYLLSQALDNSSPRPYDCV